MKRNGSFTSSAKKEAVERDGHICQICGSKTKGYATPINYQRGVRSLESSEYITLCGRCLMISSQAPDRAVSRAWKVPMETLPAIRSDVRKKLEAIQRGK